MSYQGPECPQSLSSQMDILGQIDSLSPKHRKPSLPAQDSRLLQKNTKAGKAWHDKCPTILFASFPPLPSSCNWETILTKRGSCVFKCRCVKSSKMENNFILYFTLLLTRDKSQSLCLVTTCPHGTHKKKQKNQRLFNLLSILKPQNEYKVHSIKTSILKTPSSFQIIRRSSEL